MAVGAKEIKDWQIAEAFRFIQGPMSEGFRAWSTLRERDCVTMTMRELSHLMAWYAEIQKTGQCVAIVQQLERANHSEAVQTLRFTHKEMLRLGNG